MRWEHLESMDVQLKNYVVVNNMKGFTLIEILIYVSIVAIVLVLATGFAWNIIHGNAKASAHREVQQNGRFSMERIIRAIRKGEAITIFTVSDFVLYENGVALTTDQVRVNSLQFTSIANTYNINLDIEYNNSGLRPEYNASINLESAVCLRP